MYNLLTHLEKNHKSSMQNYVIYKGTGKVKIEKKGLKASQGQTKLNADDQKWQQMRVKW